MPIESRLARGADDDVRVSMRSHEDDVDYMHQAPGSTRAAVLPA